LVQSLNGKRIEIDGYVVPLEFDITRVKEFLLVPFVGACIHVPPPPPSQIIFVKLATAVDVSRTFAPVTVRGVLRTDAASTKLADAGYTLSGAQASERNPCRAFGCRGR
jgi:hypothetical protein